MYFSEDISEQGIIGDKLIKVILKDPVKIENVLLEPRVCVFPKHMEPFIERIANYEVREDDLWIAGFPKSGNTWTLEMCWLIQNDFNFEKAKSVDIELRCPFFELSATVLTPFDSLEQISKMEGCRCIHTHLPALLLPKEIWKKNAKVIYVARDPRDVAVSLYEHLNNWFNLRVSKNEYYKLFMSGKLAIFPYFDHILEYWKLRNRPNVLFLTYEEMKTNLKEVILKTCKFLNKNINNEQLTKMLDHLSFKSMRNNKACSRDNLKQILGTANPDNAYRFIRRGIVGSYKDELPPEHINAFNEWMHENLKDTDCNLFKI